MKLLDGLIAYTAKSLADLALKMMKISVRLLNGLSKKSENSTPIPPTTIIFESFDISIGMAGEINDNGVTSYPCLQITSPDIKVRAILNTNMTKEQTLELSDRFQELLEYYDS